MGINAHRRRDCGKGRHNPNAVGVDIGCGMAYEDEYSCDGPEGDHDRQSGNLVQGDRETFSGIFPQALPITNSDLVKLGFTDEAG